MRNRKIIYGILAGFFVAALVLVGIILYSNSQELRIVFLDVGQGDAILISEGNRQILIDGGPSGKLILEKLGKHIPFWDRTIEMIIATHPDQDHIGGLIGVMENYKTGLVVESSAQSDSQVFKKYREIIQAENIQKVEAETGMKIRLAGNKEMEILHPKKGNADNQDTNAASIVAKLTFGENIFLFTGDLPGEQEMELIKSNIGLKARVLKVAHHGSKYSTTAEFLGKVNPIDAIISVGKNNKYGHPAQEVLDRLRAKGINIFRTDEEGDVQYNCTRLEELCVNVPH